MLRYFDGDLSDAELAELNSLLRGDAASRRRFVEYCTCSCLIRETFDPKRQSLLRHEQSAGQRTPSESGGRTTGVFSRSPRWMTKRHRFVRAVTAASIVIAAVVGSFLWHLYRHARATLPIGRLENVAGDVRVASADSQFRAITSDAEINSGDTIRTWGSESAATLVYGDGTRLVLVGDTSVTCAEEAYKSVVVHHGTLAASVQPQPRNRPMVLATPAAKVQVVGTQFLVNARANRTDLSVTEGRVRVTRVSDGQAIDVFNGEQAVITGGHQLVVQEIALLADSWEADFESGLPEGWESGERVSEGLPPGSHGGVKAVPLESDGIPQHGIRSNKAWMQGLVAVRQNTHLHITLKKSNPGWINVFFVTRTSDPHAPRFSGNYLFNEFPWVEPGRWQTVSIPLAKFTRLHSGTESLEQLIPFMLILTTAPETGLVVDRVWITPQGRDEVEIEAIE